MASVAGTLPCCLCLLGLPSSGPSSRLCEQCSCVETPWHCEGCCGHAIWGRWARISTPQVAQSFSHGGHFLCLSDHPALLVLLCMPGGPATTSQAWLSYVSCWTAFAPDGLAMCLCDSSMFVIAHHSFLKSPILTSQPEGTPAWMVICCGASQWPMGFSSQALCGCELRVHSSPWCGRAGLSTSCVSAHMWRSKDNCGPLPQLSSLWFRDGVSHCPGTS